MPSCIATDAILQRCNAPRHAPCPDCSVPFSSLRSLPRHQTLPCRSVCVPVCDLKRWPVHHTACMMHSGMAFICHKKLRGVVGTSWTVHVCACVSIHPSIYHGGALVNHQCQAAEWEMFYKCCLSGGRRPSPGGFNHPPNPPHPDSLHPSISPSAEVLMSSGEVGAEKEREGEEAK